VDRRGELLRGPPATGGGLVGADAQPDQDSWVAEICQLCEEPFGDLDATQREGMAGYAEVRLVQDLAAEVLDPLGDGMDGRFREVEHAPRSRR
jgi:hypothetical protein